MLNCHCSQPFDIISLATVPASNMQNSIYDASVLIRQKWEFYLADGFLNAWAYCIFTGGISREDEGQNRLMSEIFYLHSTVAAGSA